MMIHLEALAVGEQPLVDPLDGHVAGNLIAVVAGKGGILAFGLDEDH